MVHRGITLVTMQWIKVTQGNAELLKNVQGQKVNKGIKLFRLYSTIITVTN